MRKNREQLQIFQSLEKRGTKVRLHFYYREKSRKHEIQTFSVKFLAISCMSSCYLHGIVAGVCAGLVCDPENQTSVITWDINCNFHSSVLIGTRLKLDLILTLRAFTLMYTKIQEIGLHIKNKILHCDNNAIQLSTKLFSTCQAIQFFTHKILTIPFSNGLSWNKSPQPLLNLFHATALTKIHDLIVSCIDKQCDMHHIQHQRGADDRCGYWAHDGNLYNTYTSVKSLEV